MAYLLDKTVTSLNIAGYFKGLKMFQPPPIISFDSLGFGDFPRITIYKGHMIGSKLNTGPFTPSHIRFVGWTTVKGDIKTIVTQSSRFISNATLYALYKIV